MKILHLRYSPKTTSLLANLAEPRQHAVYSESVKTLCGRKADDYWKLDVPFEEKQITCSKCLKIYQKM